jgi:hypothetical protein
MVQFYGTIGNIVTFNIKYIQLMFCSDDRSDISSCVDKLNDIRPGSILVDQVYNNYRNHSPSIQ